MYCIFFNRDQDVRAWEEDEEAENNEIREDPTTTEIREVKNELSKTKQQLKAMTAKMEQQHELLVALAKKNGVTTSSHMREPKRYKSLLH